MEKPNKSRSIQVVTAGEALIDMVMQSNGDYFPAQGGAVYNFTRALARQGVGVAYLNPFSSDDLGQGLARQLVQDGAVLAQTEGILAPTSLALVRADAAGQPSYSFYREGVADRRVNADTLIHLSQNYADLQMVYTGCLALAPADEDSYLPWLAQQKAAGKKVVVDANLRPQVMPDLESYRATVWAALELADIVKISDEDILHLLGEKPSLEAYTEDDAEALFMSLPAQIVVFTKGKAGARAWRHNGIGNAQGGRGSHEIETVHVRECRKLQVADTVGAGDCFFAGFIASLLRDADEFALALCCAVASASINVERVGCQPPNLQEVEDWLAQNSVAKEP